MRRVSSESQFHNASAEQVNGDLTRGLCYIVCWHPPGSYMRSETRSA